MDASPDFRLYHGNSLDVLAGLLADELRKPVANRNVLEPDTLLIPQAALRRWLQATLAQTHGIAANLRLLTPSEFVREALRANLDEAEDAASFDPDSLRWRLFAALREPSVLRHPALAGVSAYLRGDDPRKLFAFVTELARVYEKYQAWRRDWLLRWEAGADPDDWQAELWRRVGRDRSHRARRIDAYLARCGGGRAQLPRGLPSRLFVFACINISPDALRVIASQARAGTQHFYLPTPCRNYWGDLRSLAERLRDGDNDAAFAVEENPLLERWGRAGRDFVALLAGDDLVRPSGEIAAYDDPEDAADDAPEQDNLLRRMQRDLLHRRAAPTPAWRARVDRDDASVQIHACPTRLREVQVLHDRLRDLLEKDPTLQPRDIVVLAPDLEAYRPHVAAVFGGASVQAAAEGISGHLPWAIADAGAFAATPFVDAFLRLLALPDSRFGVNEVLDLLATPAIAERFELSAEAQDQVRRWLVDAGARWGLDATHRQHLGAPADATFTWEFALDRLMLGYASDTTQPIAGVAPWCELEGGALATLDAVIGFLRVLRDCERDFSQAYTPREWQQRLLELLTRIAPGQPRDPADRRALEQVRDALESFCRQADAAGFDAPVAPEIVRAHFQAALAATDARAPLLTGGIGFSPMLPQRLIPRRVICVLGMDDAAMPRRDPAGAFNRLAAALDTPARRRGDRSLREDDRFAFLQLLAAAGDVFYLSCLGVDPGDGGRREPSALIDELLDVAAAYHADADARAQLTVRHSLQPFAPQAFGAPAPGETADPRHFSYQAQWRPGALAAGGTRTGAAVWLRAPLPAAPPVEELDLDELRGFLKDPPRGFLRHRLDIRLPEELTTEEDVEPLALPSHGLFRHRLLAETFDACVRGQWRDLHASLRARGLLPAGPLGRDQAGQLIEAARPCADAFIHWRGTDVSPATRAFDLDIDGVRLRGRLDGLYPQGQVCVRLGEIHGPAQISHGLAWLVACALDDARPLVQIVKDGDSARVLVREPIDADRARAALRELLRLRTEGLREPLPFLPRAGWLWYAARAKGSDGWDDARRQWYGGDRAWGEADTPAARMALRDRDPFADAAIGQRFRAIAIRVFDAVVEGRTMEGAV